MFPRCAMLQDEAALDACPFHKGSALYRQKMKGKRDLHQTFGKMINLPNEELVATLVRRTKPHRPERSVSSRRGRPYAW
jgi:hypothetical protein